MSNDEAFVNKPYTLKEFQDKLESKDLTFCPLKVK